MGSSSPPPPPTYDYYSGGGGGGLKLPGTGVGGSGAGGRGGGVVDGHNAGTAAVISGIRWEKDFDKDNFTFPVQETFLKLNFDNLSLVSPGSGYFINSIVEIVIQIQPYFGANPNNYSMLPLTLDKPNQVIERDENNAITNITYEGPAVNETMRLVQVNKAFFKVTAVNANGGVTNGELQSPGSFRFVTTQGQTVQHGMLNADIGDLSVELLPGSAVGTNSEGGDGLSGFEGGGGGGWGAKGGDSGGQIGGTGGAAIEVTFQGFNPTVQEGDGDIFGGVNNLNQSSQEIIWTTETDLVAGSVNTTGWFFSSTIGGVVYWGDGQFDAFTSNFTGSHQY